MNIFIGIPLGLCIIPFFAFFLLIWTYFNHHYSYKMVNNMDKYISHMNMGNIILVLPIHMVIFICDNFCILSVVGGGGSYYKLKPIRN